MILANVRARLRAADFDLALRALGRRHPERRARTAARFAAEGPDALLDEADLPAALRDVRSLEQPSAPLYVYVVVRHTLRVGGLDDADVADYVAALVLEFGDHDRATRIGRHDERAYHYLVDLVADGATEEGERAFLLRVHLGDYSLWLAGLFPDRIAFRRARAGGPDLPYYDELGRQGYDLAARHPMAGRLGTARLYRTAAERFPSLRHALNRLSDRAFFPDVLTPDKVLRLM
jgi:hypothetical protein